MKVAIRTIVAAMTAAAGLSTGNLLTATDSSTRNEVWLLHQDQKQRTREATITGTAINPDGTPGAKLPVTVQKVTKTPSGANLGDAHTSPANHSIQQDRTKRLRNLLGEATTDEDGRFKIDVKVTPDANWSGNPAVYIVIGRPEQSPWETLLVEVDKERLDLGKIQLKKKVRR